MNRTWTDESARAWIERRDAHRSAHKQDALEDLRRSDSPNYQDKYKSALNGEKKSLRERLKDYYYKTVSWDVCRCAQAAACGELTRATSRCRSIRRRRTRHRAPGTWSFRCG